MNCLALDMGTTSMRGILFDAAGTVLTSVSRRTPLCCRGDWIEQSPQRLTDCLTDICKTVAQAYPVDAVSLTAFRSTPTLVDREGRPLCDFIMWQDTRNREICEELQPFSREIFRRSGAAVNTVFTGPKLTWIRRNRPELYGKAYKAVIAPDYLLWFMTGSLATDRTYGSRTLLMNLSTLEWDEELCRLFALDPEKLCPLIPQGSVTGRITRDFQRLTGIPAGVPVISAGGDQQCGALGLGVLDSRTAMVNSGTGSFILSLTDQPELENPAMICNVSAIPGKYTAEANVFASASALNWLAEQVFPEYGGDLERLNRLAEGVPPGANGVFCLPHFQGCGTRDWNPDARAAFCGLSLRNTKADLARALYEGLAAEIAKSLAVLPACCQDAETVYLSGGLSNSGVFNRILCGMLNRPLVRYQDPQATAIGAFASAAVTLGWRPGYEEAVRAARSQDQREVFQPEASTYYEAYRRRSEALYRALAAVPAED
ncbi:MAG: hypothetical protein HFG00_01270 [Oscillibacter sp.]|nr:hypothetical protein [Oscillibacter sp.]